MPIRLGVVMDPIARIYFQKDTTIALLWAAQDRGWELYYLEQPGLTLEGGVPAGFIQPLKVFRSPEQWFELRPGKLAPLNTLDVILMRKDPPFNMDYIYATYILEAAERLGVAIINSPQGLRNHNEKLFATQFPAYAPPNLVSASITAIKSFAEQQGDIILKPLEGMGGQGIFRVIKGDPNLSVMVETLTGNGKHLIMAQRYLPEILAGDKRILMINGEPVPYCLARIPQPGETRGNLAAGGRGEVRPLTARDREICDAVGSVLRSRGLLFAGLDVIGDYLTEINITSPTCLREIEKATNLHIAENFIAVIASLLEARTTSPHNAL